MEGIGWFVVRSQGSNNAFTDFEVVRVGVAKFRGEFAFLVVHRYQAFFGKDASVRVLHLV